MSEIRKECANMSEDIETSKEPVNRSEDIEMSKESVNRSENIEENIEISQESVSRNENSEISKECLNMSENIEISKESVSMSDNRKRSKECCVRGCNADGAFAMHLFPRPGAQRATIVSKIGIPTKMDCKKAWLMRLKMKKGGWNSAVCSNHFTLDDYSPVYNKAEKTWKKGKLIKTAVPSVNLPGSSLTTSALQRAELRAKRTLRRAANKGEADFGLEPGKKRIRTLLELSTLSGETRKHGAGKAALSQVEPKRKKSKREGTLEETPPKTLEKGTQFASMVILKPKPKVTSDKETQVKSGEILAPFIAMLDNEKKLSTFTGVSSFALLDSLVAEVDRLPSMQRKKSYDWMLDTRERIILTYIKVKHNLSWAVLSVLFNVAPCSVKKYYKDTINKLETAVLKENVPEHKYPHSPLFHLKYRTMEDGQVSLKGRSAGSFTESSDFIQTDKVAVEFIDHKKPTSHVAMMAKKTNLVRETFLLDQEAARAVPTLLNVTKTTLDGNCPSASSRSSAIINPPNLNRHVQKPARARASLLSVTKATPEGNSHRPSSSSSAINPPTILARHVLPARTVVPVLEVIKATPATLLNVHNTSLDGASSRKIAINNRPSYLCSLPNQSPARAAATLLNVKKTTLGGNCPSASSRSSTINTNLASDVSRLSANKKQAEARRAMSL